MTAVGRELLGFIWAIAVRTEAKFQTEPKGRLASSMPAIPSTSIVLHPRHPSRLPFGSQQLAGAHCRSVLTGDPTPVRKTHWLRRGNGRLCPGRPSHRCFSVWKGNSAGDRTRAHGKENPPTFYAVRLHRPTRVLSPRQLPTDHDCAVPTRGYQSDQPSHLPVVLLPALSPFPSPHRKKNTTGGQRNA